MRLDRLSAVILLTVAMAACGRQTTTSNEEQSAPAVAPITPAAQKGTKHYTQADYNSACFPFPSQQVMSQYQALLHLSGQAAADYEYQRLAKAYPAPPGECEIKAAAAQRTSMKSQTSRQGQWIENAPANDMAHYGDALPGGKN